jgi:hypothetical protein
MKMRMPLVLFLCALAIFSLQMTARHAAPAASAIQSPEQKPSQETMFQEVIKAPLILPRSQDDIRADIDRAKQEGAAADKRIAAAQAEQEKASQLLQMQKGEMDAIKKRIDLIKKEKKEIDKITLEAEKKKADLVLEFLEKYKSLADAGIDGAKSEKDLAQSREAAFQTELELAQRREARDKAAAAEFATASLAASTAQEQALRAFKIVADKNQGAADKLSNIENKRMDLFKTRAKLVSGAR